MTARPIRSGLAAALLLLPVSGTAETAYDCLIEPARTVTVTTPEGGLLAEVPVSRGSPVSAGDVVARLDNSVEETTVAVLAERAGSDAEVEAQLARLALSRSQRDRLQTLVDRQIGAAGELEEAEATVEVSESEVALAELRQRIAVLEHQRALDSLERRTIRSPIDGIVTRTLLSPGEFADQSRPVVEIAQLDPLHVEAFLPISAYGSVAVGDRAIVRPAPPLEGAHEGEITVIDRVLDAASGTFGLRVTLANPDMAIPAGLRCMVEFR
ncbi:efflux RND transporter periplasmic adaptor subunit [Histidinibacterium lentulum]|uniref:Efflux RND transporter periplasmic adaptor subunit n=1 Tax=Histidinibacterium lentulum TaxID=2480588 RepID=A0A3N2R1B6_9RHOB|nr:efflux RND transporter periplasmic adaptor subunit [Histidinibacterium lentulum]ROU01254.1 efflux RND transporter periplasmic adaptor subunit [Histidinibacterium lentulum]